MARDVEVFLGDHVLQHGGRLEADVVKGRLYGKPGAPLIIIPGGISASRFLADDPQSGPDVGTGWWSDIVYNGGPIDLNHFQVLGFDLAPGGGNAKKRLTITTDDQAKRLSALLEHLGVGKAAGMIGMSYGGMVALAFAQNYPKRLERLCVLGAAHRPFPMGVALRGIQRRILQLATDLGRADEGLKLARELAMTTYRSAVEFSQRFDAGPTNISPFTFDVGDYLQACGKRYPEVMQAERFMAMSESIDLHRIDPSRVKVPVLLIATRSDQLAPPSEMQALADALGGLSELVIIESIYGHDSFLKEQELLGPILSNFINENRRAA